MGLSINTNIASLVAQVNLGRNTRNLNKTTERLSTGLKINSAADNAAGLSISETLRTQIKGLQRATENSQEGINLLQIAEGTLATVITNLQRIRELTVQAANDTNTSVERQAIRAEVESRLEAIKNAKASTSYNKIILLDGSVSSYYLRIGPNSDTATNSLDVSNALRELLPGFLTSQTNTAALSAAFSDGNGARNFINDIQTALENVISQRATLGALQSRLESTILNLQISRENLTSANSRIRDVDIAEEAAERTKQQILQQASLNVLSQANQSPAIAMNLLNSAATMQ